MSRLLRAMRGHWWALVVVSGQLTCARPAAPPPAVPAHAAAPAVVGEAEAGESPLPPLPKSPPPPATIDHPELRPVTVIARDVSDGFETLVAATGNEGLGCQGANEWPQGVSVRIEGGSDARRPWSTWLDPRFDGEDVRRTLPGGQLIVRRPIPAAGEKQIAHLTLAAGPGCGDGPHHFRFALPGAGPAVDARGALARWAAALARHVRDAGAWGTFAEARIRQRFAPSKPVAESPARARAREAPTTKARPVASAARASVTSPRRQPSELMRLMDTTTGMASLQETLQTDRWLVAPGGDPPTVPFADLKRPALPQHPWTAMQAALRGAIPDEPLATAAPASFYFVRFRSIAELVRLRAALDSGLSSGVLALESRTADYGLAARYETELGIKQGPMVRLLGPAVIEDLAVIGSDPYLREGSDLTVVFRVTSKPAFEAGLATTLMVTGAEHGGVTTSSVERGGVTIQLATSPDGALRRHRATVGEFELLSNSLSAISQVIATIQKRAPRLADEPDFRYMMGRDAQVPGDALAFLSDRFVAEVVGPRQKILEARRQLALAELSRPGFAALLHGWTFGRPPASADELVSSGLLKKEELAHADGERIAWTPAGGARSSWGRVGGLTPLIDRPPPAKVTATERDAYKLFVDGYQSYWRTYVDPVAVRMGLPEGGPLTMELRILPILDGTDYSELSRTVGRARVVVGDGRQGARAVLGIGAEAGLRRELAGSIKDLPLVGALKVDWLGDWATLGIDDLPAKTGPFGSTLSSGSVDRGLDQLVELPLYAGVAVSSPAAAAAFLAAVRQAVSGVAPGAIEWGEAGKHRGTAFVAVRSARDRGAAMFGDVALYYTFCKGSLFLSLAESALRRRIDECLDGRRPQPSPAGPDTDRRSAQLVVDVDMRERGPLWWGAVRLALQNNWNGESRWAPAVAEAVLRGAPGGSPAAVEALALRTLGTMPTTPEGRAYTLGDDGLHDPARGRVRVPDRSRWQDSVAVEGAPLVRLLRTISHLRSEVSFDDEPRPAGQPPNSDPPRSLHVKLRLNTAAP
jgi:hypothetical protein